MNKLIILFLLLLLLIIFLFFLKNRNDILYEEFSNQNYLYPIRGLQSICNKDNLKPSFMPKVCYVDGKLNSYANCKCEDDKGNCKICYDTIKKDSKNSNIVYDAKNFS